MADEIEETEETTPVDDVAETVAEAPAETRDRKSVV